MASMIMNRTWSLSIRERQTGRRPASIICPISFSGRDRVALRHATQMARQRRGKLIVVHVVPNDDGGDGLDRPGDAACEVALARLERFVPLQSGIQCERVVLHGEVAGQLVELAAGCDTPQIVMATGGRKNIGSAVMGQTAEAVVRHAPCPVVMVHDEDSLISEENEISIHASVHSA